MARKPTEAQQALYDTVSAFLAGMDEDRRHTLLGYYKPVIAKMTDAEAEDEKKIFESGLMRRMAQLYRNVKGVEAKPSFELAGLFELLSSSNTVTYWEDHPAEREILSEILLNALVENGVTTRNDKFSKMLQSSGVSTLSRSIRELRKGTDGGQLTYTVQSGESSVQWIINTFLGSEISQTTMRLLVDLLTETEKTRNRTVFISWEAYADKHGLSKSHDSLKRIREQILGRDAQILSNASYQIYRKNAKNPSVKIPLYGGYAEDQSKSRGGLWWKWSDTVFTELQKFAPMEYPKELLKANPKTSVLSVGLAICENYRYNEGKDRMSKMTIKSLLPYASTIPTIDEVTKQRQSANDKIVRAFWNILDAMNWLHYTPYDAFGKIIEDPQGQDFQSFMGSYIIVDYSDFPKHNDRVENREMHQKGGVKRRKRGCEKTQKGV